MKLTITAMTPGRTVSCNEYAAYKSQYEIMATGYRQETGPELGEPVEGRMPDIGR